jgi:quercetin dioxygenase-like cupin family protein
LIAEIPVGWHTGEHAHGEEAIHILHGEGFSVVNGTRYDWAKGSTLWMPFGARHQHFNTGPTVARYYSVMAPHLERFLGLHRTEQFSACGPSGSLPAAPRSPTGLDGSGLRIVLRWEEAPRRTGKEDGRSRRRLLRRLRALALGVLAQNASAVTGPPHHSLYIDFMRHGTGFQNREVEISGILSDRPRTHGGKHAHMEAILYILQGEGYSIVDGEKIPWKKGTCLHIQGPQTVHQHFNTSDVDSQMLRAASGIRVKYFQHVAQERFPYLRLEPGSDD